MLHILIKTFPRVFYPHDVAGKKRIDKFGTEMMSDGLSLILLISEKIIINFLAPSSSIINNTGVCVSYNNFTQKWKKLPKNFIFVCMDSISQV